MSVSVRLDGPVSGDVAAGAVTVAPEGGVPLEVPWAAVLKAVPAGLIGFAKLSSSRFKPSDVTPAVLIAQLGEVDEQGIAAPSVEPLSHLDIQLRTKAGKNSA